MKKNLQNNSYSQLVKDITELYDYVRHAVVVNTPGVGSLLTADSIYGARSRAIRYNT